MAFSARLGCIKDPVAEYVRQSAKRSVPELVGCMARIWNRVLEFWGARQLGEPTALEITAD
jgi:hypothetical protein